MWYLITSLLSIFFILLNVSFINSFNYVFIPNLILIYTVYLIMYESDYKIIGSAVLIGLFVDHLSTGSAGFYVALLILTSSVFIYIKKIMSMSNSHYLALIFIALITIIFFFTEMYAATGKFNLNLLYNLFVRILINYILLLLLTPILNKIYLQTKTSRELKRYV